MNSSTDTDGNSFKPGLWPLAVTAVVVGLLIAFLSNDGVGLAWLGKSIGDRGASETQDVESNARGLTAMGDQRSAYPASGPQVTESLGLGGRVLPVNTLVATSTPAYQQVRVYKGVVKARRTSDVSFGRSARLTRLIVEPGKRVESGDALAEQDTRQLELQKSKLEQAKEQAEAELAKMIGDASLRSMESIRIEVRDLRTELEQIRKELNRRDGGSSTSGQEPGLSPNPGLVPNPDSSPSQDPRAATQSRVNAAQQRLAVLEATSSDPKVSAQQSVVADLSQQIAELENALQESTLRAPFDGVISRQYVHEGMLVSPEVPIMSVVELSSLQAWIGIPVDVVDEFQEGQKYLIRVGDGGADTEAFEATLFAKSPELDQSTRTRTVIFSLDPEASTTALPGEVARIELSRSIADPGYWLPITSLTRASRGLWSVFAVSGDRGDPQVVTRRHVEVVHLEGERVRVRGTLDDGDLIVADGIHRVVPGQRVEPIPVNVALQFVPSGIGPSEGSEIRDREGATPNGDLGPTP